MYKITIRTEGKVPESILANDLTDGHEKFEIAVTGKVKKALSVSLYTRISLFENERIIKTILVDSTH